MRVVSRKTLRLFWEKAAYRDAEQPLRAWYAIAAKAAWSGPNEVRATFGSASIVGGGRVVFNIAGNKYRLVVKMIYDKHGVYIRFVGTHAEYDRIDAKEV